MAQGCNFWHCVVKI